MKHVTRNIVTPALIGSAVEIHVVDISDSDYVFRDNVWDGKTEQPNDPYLMKWSRHYTGIVDFFGDYSERFNIKFRGFEKPMTFEKKKHLFDLYVPSESDYKAITELHGTVVSSLVA